MKISAGDWARMALAPLHVVIGGVLIEKFAAGARTPMVLVLGVAFVTYGLYKLALIRRGLRGDGGARK
jgi:hypothetical protein